MKPEKRLINQSRAVVLMFEFKTNKQVIFCIISIIIADLIYCSITNKNQYGRGVMLGGLNFSIGISVLFYLIKKFKEANYIFQIIISSICVIFVSFILLKFKISSNFILGIVVGFVCVIADRTIRLKTMNK